MARVLNGGSRFTLLTALIGVLAALVTAVAATASDELVLWVSDVTTVLAAAAATVFCLRARARLHGAVRRFWALLAAATAAWTLAEVTWSVYDLVLRTEVPLPSWADVGYLGAIPLTVAALVSHPAMRDHGMRLARRFSEGALVATALLFLSWTLVLGPLWHQTELGTAGGLVGLAYPFGDVVIVFFIVLALRGMTGGDRRPMWCLLGALLLMALTDSVYTYLTSVADYASGSLIDVGWTAAYLGIALAAWDASDLRDEAPAQEEESSLSLVSLTAPLLPVLLSLVAATVQMRQGHELGVVGWGSMCALIALVLVRQATLLAELFGAGDSGQLELSERMTRAAAGERA